MKKTYSAPSATEVKLQLGSSVMLVISGNTLVGGSGDTGPGQLSRGRTGWTSEDWTDTDEEEDY